MQTESGCNLHPCLGTSCGPFQAGWEQLHANQKFYLSTHTSQKSGVRWGPTEDTYLDIPSPHDTPSDPFPCVLISPLPWVLSALPFSREISLNLEGLQSKRTNYLGGKLQWKISSKILSPLHIFMGWLNPRFLSLLVCFQFWKHSGSPFQSTCVQRTRTLLSCVFMTRQGAREDAGM